MKDSQIIIDINNMDDIKKIKDNKNIKYINIDIEKPNLEVIYYLLENGKDYPIIVKAITADTNLYSPSEASIMYKHVNQEGSDNPGEGNN